jgi:DNA-binding MarR family transcriptional regulator
LRALINNNSHMLLLYKHISLDNSCGAHLTLHSETIRDFLDKIYVLKELDSVIDFGRSSNQLSLVLHLYATDKPVTTEELSRDLSETRRSILDSIRKLEKKKLIIRREIEGETYVELSEKGKKYVDRILELVKPLNHKENNLLEAPNRLNMVEELIESCNLLKLVVKSGLPSSRVITVDDFNKVFGDGVISEKMLRYHAVNPTGVFKVVVSGENEALALSETGLELLKKTPHYQAYLSKPVYRFLVKLYKTPLIGELLTRINMSITLIVLFLIALTIITGNYWVTLLILVATISQIILNFYLNKLLTLIT